MARLWMKTQSDLRKGTGKGASESARVSINWGSAGDSKNAASVEVHWHKGETYPSVIITIGEKENYLPWDNVTLNEHVAPNENTCRLNEVSA